ncbi:Schizosaccharomyces specific protein [Schizosaccharomyces osmophilus]|uniref:Schizosaccharomyces specific protein n=1 Tax=Schizosaccharomyces osmophilus TaxID=2545709 RepID=A0AAE9WE45_9SCHI|nr:Schizosaccharomyces specific protein [Schizosaccharomyces osmophilus]WBW73566.1 Schizosaccharomyces specific protein [Schizosaccharomyces osmophilus]
MEHNSSRASRLNSKEEPSTSNTQPNARQLLGIQVPRPISFKNDPFGFDSVKGIRLSSTLESDSSALRSGNQALKFCAPYQDSFERILSSSPPVVNEGEFLKNVEDPSFNVHSKHPLPLSASSPKQVPLPASSPPNYSSSPSSPIPLSSVTTSSMHPPSSSRLSSRSSFPKDATTRQLERFVPIPHGNLKKRLRKRSPRENDDLDLSILHSIPNSSPPSSASESEPEFEESQLLWKLSKRTKVTHRQSDSSFTLDNENLEPQRNDKHSSDGSSSDEDSEKKQVLDEEQQKRMDDMRQYYKQIDQYSFQVVDD